MLLATTDLGRARDKSLGERNDVLGDRRPELYGTVLGGSASVIRETVP